MRVCLTAVQRWAARQVVAAGGGAAGGGAAHGVGAAVRMLARDRCGGAGGGCNRRDDTVVCVLTPVLQLQGFAQLGLLRHAPALLPLHRQIHGHPARTLFILFIPHPLKTKDIACLCPIISVVLGRNRLRRQRRRPTAVPLRRRLQLPPPKTHLVSIRPLHNQQRDACPALCFSLQPSMFVLLICCSFALAAVIEGWRQALRLMSEGEKRSDAHDDARVQCGIRDARPKDVQCCAAAFRASGDAARRRHVGHMAAVITGIRG